jgi:AcrR family transcriptional regulator
MARPKGSRDAGYADRRAALLRRLAERLALMDGARQSLSQLAVAAGVSIPTLKYYFGSRDAVVGAVLADCRRRGEPFMNSAAAAPECGLRQSVHQFLAGFSGGLMHAPVGDVMAFALVEGLLSRSVGPVAAAEVLDPAADALEARLAAHVRRGEMAAGVDLRHAALMLLSPVIVAALHQKHLCGAAGRPLDIAALCDSLADGFAAAYALEPSSAMAS